MQEEYLEYLKKDIEPFEVSDQPVGPSGETLQENGEDEEEEEYEEEEDDDEDDDDDEEGEDDEADEDEMIHMVVLNKVMEQFKEQYGREPSEDEVSLVVAFFLFMLFKGFNTVLLFVLSAAEGRTVIVKPTF